MRRTRFFDFCSGYSGGRQWLRMPLALIALATFAARTFGQEYFTLPIDEKAAKNSRSVAMQCMKDTATYNANTAKFEEYFKNYHFPAMTRTEPDKLGELGKLRDDFFKSFVYARGVNAGMQQTLTDLTFVEMRKIVGAQNPPCHPTARYNAILILGLLDQKYTPDGRQPPEPLPVATKALTFVVDSATTDNRFPPPVILGAVIGLERHAQYRQSLPAEAVSAMTAALLKLVTHNDPIQEMDRDAYSWLRLRAASALARLGTVGDKNAIHDAIVKLAASGKSLDDRCEAAALLDKLEYKDVKLDAAGTAEPLFALAREVAAAIDQKAQEFQDKYSGSGGVPGPEFSGRVGPEGFAPGGVTTTIEIFPRRQTLSRLWDLRAGLKKVNPALPEESQKKVDAVLTALNPAITATANKDTVELTLAVELRKMAEAINTAVPAAEKAATDKAKEDSAF